MAVRVKPYCRRYSLQHMFYVGTSFLVLTPEGLVAHLSIAYVQLSQAWA
jgi:hypothetical protein